MSALFDKLGGQQGVDKVVGEFYKRVMADGSLSPFFAKTDMAKQHAQQVAFFTQLFDGPKVYNGRAMEKTHTGMNLQPQHFDAIVKHLRDSLAACGASADDANAAVDRVSKLQGTILNK
ncbi:MAG: group 1 truncated hemoglobin [Scytonema sp. PMC 1069.18]|nr:group 1 truncated hemoglobin [Scytonema sp. PMC 1069.18]MEC4884337.1 group 1 truncated hemoglobin [Scytonema sp. PMC 1070.18]